MYSTKWHTVLTKERSNDRSPTCSLFTLLLWSWAASMRHGSSHHIQNVFSLEGIWDTRSTTWIWNEKKKMKYVSHIIFLYVNIPLVMLRGCTSSGDPGLSKASCLSQWTRVRRGLQILALTKAHLHDSSYQGAHEHIGDSACSLCRSCRPVTRRITDTHFSFSISASPTLLWFVDVRQWRCRDRHSICFGCLKELPQNLWFPWYWSRKPLTLHIQNSVCAVFTYHFLRAQLLFLVIPLSLTLPLLSLAHF